MINFKREINNDLTWVLTEDEHSFLEILNDFNNTKHIAIVSFSISQMDYCCDLLKRLAALDEDIKIDIIVNIPLKYKKSDQKTRIVNKYLSVLS